MGKLEGKVAVITGGSSGLARESAKRFVEEGAYVFITGRRQEALDEAVKLIAGTWPACAATRPISTTSIACSIRSSGPARPRPTSVTKRRKPSRQAADAPDSP